MRISICIPAYNRGEYLPELLDSILRQDIYACELEVVISDNASTDDTQQVVDAYRSKFDRLVYHRADENMGADRNFLKVVELASGDFCWLMGSDDRLREGAMAVVEKVLRDYPTVAGISVRRNLRGADMEELTHTKYEHFNRPSEQIRLIDRADDIFKALGVYVGYLSGNVLSRSQWNRVVAECPVDKFYNAWVHVYVIGQMIRRNPQWVYVPSGCVDWRMNNDSFLAEGNYRRLEIDVRGYSDITQALFGRESPVYRHMMGRMLPHARHRILATRAQGRESGFTPKARALIARYYKPLPSLWVQILPALYAPQPILSAISKARHSVLERRRARP